MLASERLVQEDGSKVKPVKKDEQGLTDYEAALLDTVARILRDELSQLEKPGPVDERDVARFLQSAKASKAFYPVSRSVSEQLEIYLSFQAFAYII